MDKVGSIVLVSGGMDSCVTAAMAIDDLKTDSSEGRTQAGFLHVTYGQRTASRERRAFQEISDFFGIRTRMVADIEYLTAIGGSALTDTQIGVPMRDQPRGALAQGRVPSRLATEEQSRGSGIPITYVPFRNTHLLAIAVSWAEVIGAGRIYVGAVAEDSSGYPDCRPEYYQAFNELIQAGTRPETQVEVVAPIIGLRKSEIVRRGIALGAPLHLTWSCYQNDDVACGVCDSCILRRRAFMQTGMDDLIPYATNGRPREAVPSGRL